MIYSKDELVTLAETTGFRIEIIEKVLHLFRLLNAFNSHPGLKGKFVLKGGTAINLFLLNMPRLSVDIDLNYVGELEREKMLQQRPVDEEAIQSVFSRENFGVKRMPVEHAGGKWRLVYQSFNQQNGNIEIDLNYMYRCPLWGIMKKNSSKIGMYQAKNIPILDIHELTARKIAALLTRCQSRDLFDCPDLVRHKDIDFEKLRLTLIVYGSMSRTDWRTISPDNINWNPIELQRQLLPVINTAHFTKDETEKLGKTLVETCRKVVSKLLTLRSNEKCFLDSLLDNGDIKPELLTNDQKLQERIQNQPMLQWKALNVRGMKKK